MVSIAPTGIERGDVETGNELEQGLVSIAPTGIERRLPRAAAVQANLSQSHLLVLKGDVRVHAAESIFVSIAPTGIESQYCLRC